ADQTSTVARLRKGRHSIVIRDSKGQQLERHDVELRESGVFVLNVLNAQTYFLGSLVYSNSPNAESPPEETLRKDWVEVSHIRYVFTELPPSITRYARDGVVLESVTYIRRTPLRRGPP